MTISSGIRKAARFLYPYVLPNYSFMDKKYSDFSNHSENAGRNLSLALLADILIWLIVLPIILPIIIFALIVGVIIVICVVLLLPVLFVLFLIIVWILIWPTAIGFIIYGFFKTICCDGF